MLWTDAVRVTFRSTGAADISFRLGGTIFSRACALSHAEVFVLVRRIPGAADRDESVEILGVYSDERQVGEKAKELNGATRELADDACTSAVSVNRPAPAIVSARPLASLANAGGRRRTSRPALRSAGRGGASAARREGAPPLQPRRRLTHQAEATTSRTSTPSSVTSSRASAAIALIRSPTARAFSSESKMIIESPSVSAPPEAHVQ